MQLTLDGRDTRVKVTTMREYGPDWFAAKCVACGGWLSKFDFTEDEAVAVAVHALEREDSGRHHCLPSPSTSTPTREHELAARNQLS